MDITHDDEVQTAHIHATISFIVHKLDVFGTHQGDPLAVPVLAVSQQQCKPSWWCRYQRKQPIHLGPSLL